MTETILILEDEVLLGSELARHYEKQGLEVVLVSSCTEARKALKSRRIDPLLILSDMSLPDGNGLDLLEEVATFYSATEWIFLTGYGSVPDSVRAVRLGAFDFLTKPCSLDKLDLSVRSALRSAAAQRRLQADANDETRRYGFTRFLGNSAAATQTREMLRQLSLLPISAIILTGETGTGKGLAARILHYNGPRADNPLIELNCAALPRELIESELFGHEAGAFTSAKGRHRGLMEQAHGGTLFLDEIGELPLDLQSKLLKVLEDKSFHRLGGEREIKVDFQIVAATNRDLSTEIKSGSFRADLYHRLSVIELRLPSLRERQGDLCELVPEFLMEFNKRCGKNVNQLSPQAWRLLESHAWPGNVRELRNVIERCVLLSQSSMLPEQWLHLNPGPNFNESGAPDVTKEDYRLTGTAEHKISSAPDNGLMAPDRICFTLDGAVGLDEMVGDIISHALDRQNGNVSEVARLLKTTREKIRYRIGKLKLRP